MNTAEPATSTFAPAFQHNGAVSGSTPPSTSSQIGLSPIIFLAADILSIIEYVNFCPPNPGLIVIINIKSILSKQYSITESGVVIFNATPALQP